MLAAILLAAIRYIGAPLPAPDRPDGGLPPAVGVQSYQVMRATRPHPELSDGRGWTYNHAQTITYWNGRFYLEFINSPYDEHGWPTHAVLTTSADGRSWTMPRIVFPAWESDRETRDGLPLRSLIHQRMGFYHAPDGRLLVLSHYGLWPKPLGGPGHVAREVHADGSLGPVYFVRYGEGWNEQRAFYPFYLSAEDKGFSAACDSLLADRFVTDQWFETNEGYPPDAYIRVRGQYDPKSQRKALSFYRRADGKMVALWKRAWTALSEDGGLTWTDPVQAPGFARTFAKFWGQGTSDGRYAIAYCPQDHPPGARWPLAVVTSADGATFDGMLSVHGEVPLRRYPGLAKDIGPQYVRGLEGGAPPGGGMWLTYSVNKEDIWVSRVPVPIRDSVDRHVNDSFDDMEPGGVVADWNIYSPLWAPVEVVLFPTPRERCLRLQDGDPYDYARAVRVFPHSVRVSVGMRVLAAHNDRGRLEIELLDREGRRPVRAVWLENGMVSTVQGARMREGVPFEAGVWYDVRIDADAARQVYSLWIGGKRIATDAPFAEQALSLERLSLRTGEYRGIHTEQAPRGSKDGPADETLYYAGAIVPATDHPLPPASFYIDNVRTSAVK